MQKRTDVSDVIKDAKRRVNQEPTAVHDLCNRMIHWLRMGRRRHTRSNERWAWRDLRTKAAYLLR